MALQAMYGYIFELCNGNPVILDALGWLVFTGLWFWILSLTFLYTDVTGRPSWMYQYKIQTPNEPPNIDMTKLKRAIKGVAFNTIVLHTLFFYPLHVTQAWYGVRFAVNETPGFIEIIRDMVGIVLIQEVIFYYSHRLFHHPWVYKRVHKQHHEWTAPVGLIAVYSGTIEYTTGNGMSIFLGPMLMKSHILTIWIWYFLAITTTVIHHSGYHLPFLPSSEFHDFHHLKFVGNYGTLGVLDWLHGTDKAFRERIESKRHRTLWSTTPIYKLYPGAPSQSPYVKELNNVGLKNGLHVNEDHKKHV